ncbi:hypothetical protein HMPREF3039_01764 [Akkermansia sp. KLE1798]|nr:hypothetical protein HMPREF3039_01764 [Akkermansia sp. KLE1798]KZA05585.1 hypothetical protein HMPREF1326_00760 [Akkermansia sp. KLE1605]
MHDALKNVTSIFAEGRGRPACMNTELSAVSLRLMTTWREKTNFAC